MTFNGTLFPYQEDAVNRMVADQRLLVAFDMGTGKTVLALAACERLMEDEVITRPVLVLTPKSLKYQWAQSVEKFTDSGVLVIDGTPKQRENQYLSLADWEVEGIDYVVANYDQVVNDADLYAVWGAIVVDEATAIKSFRSKRSVTIKKMAEKSPVKFALTGTPLENGKPEELFSIMQFVNPQILGEWYAFDSKFIVRNPWGGIQRYKELDVLHDWLGDSMVRKSSHDPEVAPYMPTLVHRDPIKVHISPSATTLYNTIREDLLADLDAVVEMGGGNFDIAAHYGEQDADKASQADRLRGSMMSKITALRQLCDHPDLLRRSAADYRKGEGKGSEYAFFLDDNGLLDKATKSPKLEFTSQYISDFLDEDPSYKAVIFSAWVPMLPTIAESLKQYGSVLYSGDMSAKVRDANKVQFQSDPDTRIFISSDAGGYGVDLPQANLLLNFSLPWSAGAYMQRNARIRRASSEWDHVTVQYVIIGGTIEERVFAMLNDKRGIQSAVVDGIKAEKGGGFTLTAGSLRAFLRDASFA